MPLQVICPSCATRLKVADNLAGRKVKCPKCSTICPVGTAGADQAATPARAPQKATVPGGSRPPAAPPRKQAPPREEVPIDDSDVVGSDGDDSPLRLRSFEELEVPDSMREAIENELTGKEKLLWLGRQSKKLAMSNARLGRFIGIIILIAVVAGAVIGVILKAPPLVLWIPVGFLTLIGTLLLLAPWLVKKGEKYRPTYAITNRRALICQAIGFGGGDIKSYNGTRLLEMKSREWRRFPGCGDLIFEVEIHTSGGGPDLRRGRAGRASAGGSREHTQKVEHGFMMIEHLNEVEQLVREKLVDPLTS